MGSIPGLGRFPRGRHGKPLQYSCLENPMDRGAWRAIVLRVTKSWTWLRQRACMHAVQIIFTMYVLSCVQSIAVIGDNEIYKVNLPSRRIYSFQWNKYLNHWNSSLRLKDEDCENSMASTPHSSPWSPINCDILAFPKYETLTVSLTRLPLCCFCRYLRQEKK